MPAVAARTFQEKRDDPSFFKLTKQVIKKLKKISDPIKRARRVHKEIDRALQPLLEDKLISDCITCNKGCTACCHTQVAITKDEAQLLAARISEGTIINQHRLAIQAAAHNDSDAWYEIPHKDRGCVFLDDQGSCNVYDDRPSVCRCNSVVSDPALCSTKDGEVKAIQLLHTHKADMVNMGAFLTSSENSTLPFLLKKVLDQKKLNDLLKRPIQSVNNSSLF